LLKLLRLTFICILCHGFMYGYAQNYFFELLNTSQGLPSPEIFALGKDYKGYLWIGTNVGLSKYDGYSFENFQYSYDNHLIGKVNVIKEDDKHRLWIGADAGLFVQIADRIYKSSNDGMPRQGINAIYPERDGSLWLGTEAGIALLDKETVLNAEAGQGINVKKYILPAWKNLELDEARATIITKANDGTYYFAGISTLYEYNGHTLKTIYQCNKNHDLPTQIIPVNKNKLYFLTSRYGWHIIENGKYTKLSFKDIYKPAAKPAGQSVWVLTSLNAYHFFPDSGIITEHLDLQEQGVLWISDLLMDQQKNIWIATHAGLLKFKPTFFHTYPAARYPMLQEVFSIAETHDEHFLLGSNRGKLFTRTENSFKFFLADSAVVSLAEVFAIYEDKNYWLWFATGYQGIAVLRNHVLQHLTMNNGLRNNSNYFFYRTRNGRFFVTGDEGISEIIADSTTESISFKNYHYSPSVTQYAKFFACTEAPDGTLWAGGQEGIFYLRNDSLLPFPLLDKYISVTDIKDDQHGNIWIATEGQGVLKCAFNENRKIQVMRQYNHSDGLNTDIINKILIDRPGNIWLGSYKGLSLIPHNESRIVNFDGNDGFFNTSYYGLSLYQDRKGIIWAGCNTGLISFDPAEILISAYQPPAYITAVNLTDAKENISKFADSVAENLPVYPALPYNQNYLRFHFSAIDFSNQETLQYLYKLEGSDTGWMNAGNLRYVIYQRLPPGKYTFRVKAVNNKGVQSKQPASFSFTIRNPFWKTWWFIVVCSLTAVCLLFLFYRYRINQLLKLQRVRNSIATDLHDDIGSSLTNIAILSELSNKNITNPGQAKIFLERISEEVTDSGQALDDIVWSINARNDTLEQTSTRMRRYAAEIFDGSNIVYSLEMNEQFANHKLGMEQRRDLFLIFKESINNIYKHAGAKKVTIQIGIEKKQLYLSITDDGKGFDTNLVTHRNGLKNIEHRIQKWKGNLVIQSATGKGTWIRIYLP
jgi:ligand-binding sensor domain-containing protein/two-component sensor histidine kinase